MHYDYIEERIMLTKCGNHHAFESLMQEGCGCLYLYAAMVSDNKAERISMVKETYVTAWDRLQMLEIPDEFDTWLKDILWQKMSQKTGLSKHEAERRAKSGVKNLIRKAYLLTESYWYLSLDEKIILVSEIMDIIKSGDARELKRAG